MVARGTLEDGGVFNLFDFVNGEVGRVDVGRELRLKGCADGAQIFKLDTAEEAMRFDLVGGATTKAILRVADETR